MATSKATSGDPIIDQVLYKCYNLFSCETNLIDNKINDIVVFVLNYELSLNRSTSTTNSNQYQDDVRAADSAYVDTLIGPVNSSNKSNEPNRTFVAFLKDIQQILLSGQIRTDKLSILRCLYDEFCEENHLTEEILSNIYVQFLSEKELISDKKSILETVIDRIAEEKKKAEDEEAKVEAKSEDVAEAKEETKEESEAESEAESEIIREIVNTEVISINIEDGNKILSRLKMQLRQNNDVESQCLHDIVQYVVDGCIGQKPIISLEILSNKSLFERITNFLQKRLNIDVYDFVSDINA